VRRRRADRAGRGWPAWLARRAYDNGLSLALAALFLAFLIGQSLTGFQVNNAERAAHAEPPLSYAAYLRSDHFAEATFENWESEFLQMAAYVVLTAMLIQRGSAESNDPDASARQSAPGRAAPWPVRRGGWVLRLYEHSLSLALALLFFASFVLHGLAGARHYNAEQLQHGETPIGIVSYFATAQFWFESLQNWQSEFLAILAMVVLSIFLREKGSAESKDVAAPHHKTGA
jgi:hypothetical protein